VSRIPIKELRQMGVAQEDIELAKQTQAAQRRNGSPVQSIGVIVGAVEPRKKHNPNPPTSLTDRAMRKRGTYDQAALLLDQQALQERSPERALKARNAAKAAKELSAAQQLEFDFFGGGNVSIAFQYQDAVTERLRNSRKSLAKQHQALAVLWQITRHLGWQSYECSKTASDLCDLTGITPNNMTPILKLLEEVGAIKRVKRGRVKVITVTPEGAFRGNIHNHAQSVERYKLDVIDGGKKTDTEE
jgi:DNA-binding MarR family transcriptional regulator